MDKKAVEGEMQVCKTTLLHYLYSVTRDQNAITITQLKTASESIKDKDSIKDHIVEQKKCI